MLCVEAFMEYTKACLHIVRNQAQGLVANPDAVNQETTLQEAMEKVTPIIKEGIAKLVHLDEEGKEKTWEEYHGHLVELQIALRRIPVDTVQLPPKPLPADATGDTADIVVEFLKETEEE